MARIPKPLFSFDPFTSPPLLNLERTHATRRHDDSTASLVDSNSAGFIPVAIQPSGPSQIVVHLRGGVRVSLPVDATEALRLLVSLALQAQPNSRHLASS